MGWKKGNMTLFLKSVYIIYLGRVYLCLIDESSEGKNRPFTNGFRAKALGPSRWLGILGNAPSLCVFTCVRTVSLLY